MTLLARISLTLSHHPSPSSIAPGRSSRLYPVSALYIGSSWSSCLCYIYIYNLKYVYLSRISSLIHIWLKKGTLCLHIFLIYPFESSYRVYCNIYGMVTSFIKYTHHWSWTIIGQGEQGNQLIMEDLLTNTSWIP